MKKISNLLWLLVFLFAGLSSCKKELLTQSISSNSKAKAPANTNFNWETAQNMPISPNYQGNQVPMPWQSQSGSPIDSYLINDYKSSDGWQLVYNTFNTSVYPTASQQPAGGLYFALYNVYRGLLRFYLYIPPNYVQNNASIEHGLAVYSDNSSTSKMLNFEGGDIVDPTSNISVFTKTNNTGIAYGGGWYAMQYQIAYDPAFSATVYPHLGFTWNSRTVSISQIVINGTSAGTITGNITQQSSGFNWRGALTNAVAVAAEIYGVTGDRSEKKITDAATGGLAGNITGFFDAILGGNSANSQSVDLKMNSTISLNGTLTSSQPLTPNSVVVPGQTTANTVSAPTPIYPAPLGVFNFPNKPLVHISSTRSTAPSSWDGPSNAYYVNSFTVDPAFVSSIQKNTTVTSGTSAVSSATVAVQSTQILLENFDAGSSFYNYSPVTETIGNISVYDNTTIDGRIIGASDATALVRVVVLVTPSNSTTPPVKIVKTFLATLTSQ